MATMQPAPKLSVCAEKVRLTDAVLEAVRAVTEIQDRQTKAVIQGGNGLDGHEIALQQARDRRDEARRELVEHIQEHGC